MRNQKGNASLLGMFMLIPCCLLFALFLQYLNAFCLKAIDGNTLDTARETLFDAGFSMRLKNSDEPALQIANRVCSFLRSNGFDGKVTVYVEEASPESVPSNTRAIACMVAIERDLGTARITNQTCASMVPYSPSRAWRPDSEKDSANSTWTYTLAAGKPLDELQQRSEEMPQAIDEELDKAMETAESKEAQ